MGGGFLPVISAIGTIGGMFGQDAPEMSAPEVKVEPPAPEETAETMKEAEFSPSEEKKGKLTSLRITRPLVPGGDEGSGLGI